MADLQGDSRVAQDDPGTSQDVAALRAKYMPAPAAKASVPISAAADPDVPLVGKAAGAKTLQSATFGFGADLAGKVMGKQYEQSIRGLEKQYDAKHPMASFGIDLAVAGAMNLVPILGEAKDASLAATGLKAVGQHMLGGAAAGAAQGVGAGGDAGQRTAQGIQGAIVGGATGGVLSYAAGALRPAMQKLGLLSSDKAAAGAISRALAADGKSPAQLQEFLQKNPSGRLVDFSPKVADAVAGVADKGNTTKKVIGDTVRSDKEDQLDRVTGAAAQAAPLANLSRDMIANAEKIGEQMQTAYTASKAETTKVTPDLQKILDHPEVKPLYEKAMSDYQAGKEAGVAGLSAKPRYTVGQDKPTELPSGMLDDLQKAVNHEANAEGTGMIRRGTLNAVHAALKSHQTGSVIDAQALAARLGGDAGGKLTGIIGAQTWGRNYAMGLKTADIADFRKMNSEQEAYAQLGMVHGMTEYLTNAGRMSEGSLSKIADKLRDPMLEEVLGKKNANTVRTAFKSEAARQRVNAGIERAAGHADQGDGVEKAVGHVAVAAATGGKAHILRTAARVLTSNNISEKQATSMVNIAMKPGGMARLRAAGTSQKVLDAIAARIRFGGTITGSVAEQQNLQEQN